MLKFTRDLELETAQSPRPEQANDDDEGMLIRMHIITYADGFALCLHMFVVRLVVGGALLWLLMTTPPLMTVN